MGKFDVVGFGALNLDKLFRVNRIAGKQEESFIVGYEETCGGSAANTIVGLSRLGITTGFIGKIAKDREGKILLNNLENENVNTECIIKTSVGKSGVVHGFVDEEGERALYVAPGVNDEIDFREISVNYAKRANLVHLSSFVGEKSFLAQKALVEQLPEHIKITLDPGMLYAQRGLPALESLLKRALAFLPNETELKMLTKSDYKRGAATILQKGAKIAGIKLGKKGCYVTNGKETHLVKPLEAKVVDTTGAGDAWDAGFIYGLLNNKKLLDCAKLANFVASKSIEKKGARAGLPRLEDLADLS